MQTQMGIWIKWDIKHHTVNTKNLIFDREDVELVGLLKPQLPHPNQYRELARWYEKHSQMFMITEVEISRQKESKSIHNRKLIRIKTCRKNSL